jgi:hypothetical protein
MLKAMTVAIVMAFSIRKSQRVLAVVLGCAVLVGTVALAWSGVHDVYRIGDGTVTMRLAQPMTPASLYVGTTALHLVVLLVGARFVARYRRAVEAAETKGVLLSWRLSKLLPSDMPGIGTP